MTKKFFALFLALCMIFSLVACGGSANNGGEVKDNGAQQGDAQKDQGNKDQAANADIEVSLSVQAEKDWKPYYEEAVARVKEKFPKANIEVKEIGAFDHLNTIDSTGADNKDVCDVFALPADRLVDLAGKEVLAALPSEKMAEELGGFADFNAGLGGNFKINNEYLAFPYNIETLICFVNKANAEKKGYKADQAFELTEMKDPQTMLLPLFDAWYGVAVTNSAQIELLGKDKDGKLFSDMVNDFDKLPAEKQDLFKAIYGYWKMNFEQKTPLFDKDAGWSYIDESFKSGNGGVIRLGGPWDTANNVKLANDGKDLEIVPINHMTINGRPLVHWKGGWGLGINSRIEEDANKMLVAEELIKEIVNPKHAEALFKATGKILENVSKDEYMASGLDDTNKKVIAAVLDSYKDAPARPLFKEWGQVWDTWKNAVLSWNAVKPADPAAAYKELQAAFEAMMKNFK